MNLNGTGKDKCVVSWSDWIGYGISICQTQQQYQPTVGWQCMLFEPVQSDFTYLRRSGNQLCNDRYEAYVAKTRNPKTKAYDCYIRVGPFKEKRRGDIRKREHLVS